jgi:hypothetical protein
MEVQAGWDLERYVLFRYSKMSNVGGAFSQDTDECSAARLGPTNGQPTTTTNLAYQPMCHEICPPPSIHICGFLFCFPPIDGGPGVEGREGMKGGGCVRGSFGQGKWHRRPPSPRPPGWGFCRHLQVSAICRAFVMQLDEGAY